MTPLPLARLHGNAFRETFSNAFFKEGSLLGNIDQMSADQLRERLLVAESLMKKLYNRNKDIETYHRQKQESQRKKAGSALEKRDTEGDELADDNNKEEQQPVHELDMI